MIVIAVLAFTVCHPGFAFENVTREVEDDGIAVIEKPKEMSSDRR